MRRLETNPAVAILGPRQSGKTTLARHLVSGIAGAIYLDLEYSRDRAKLDDPVAYFDVHRDGLVCLDEIQRVPELFTVLRSVIDRRGENGQFLILGSASRDLIKQSSESLAGRMSYLELSPFLVGELESEPYSLNDLWIRGGFPRSLLAEDDATSVRWREDFTTTFLERDLAQLGVRVDTGRLGRFWRMVAHSHGSLLNASKLGDALGVSAHTVRSYLELLSHTFMVRLLPPDTPNVKNRLVKSPKVYLRDSGLLHALLDIRCQDDLLGHPIRGASFEGLAIENILSSLPGWRGSFYRTHAGAEIDLVLRRGRRTVAVELKAAAVPKVSRGFWSAVETLQPDAAHLVAPVPDAYPLREGVDVLPLNQLIRRYAGRAVP